MKLYGTIVLSVAFFEVIIAQADLFSELPECSVRCLSETIPITSCSPEDIQCLCTDVQFLQAAAGCQALNCTVEETLTATNATQAACGIPQADRSSTIIAICASFGALTIVMMVLRLVQRLWISRASLGWDDGLVVSATIVACPMNVACIAMALSGMGKNIWTLEFYEITRVFLLLYIAMPFYMAAEALVQISLLAFYLRVFTCTGKFKIVVWIMMGIAACFGCANTLAMLFQCRPISFFWEGWSQKSRGTCFNINIFSWARAAIEITIDLAIMILPLPMLAKLQMSLRKKIQVMAMFSIGFVVTIISIFRLRSLVRFAKTQNPTYDNTEAIYWSVLECDIFIILACMPAMRAILRYIFPSCFGSTEQGSYDQSGYSGSRKQYRRQSSQGTPESSAIRKTVGVSIYNTERSGSDVELEVQRATKDSAW